MTLKSGKCYQFKQTGIQDNASIMLSRIFTVDLRLPRLFVLVILKSIVA